MINITIRGLGLADPLAVSLPPRSFVGGPNGAGKSTILNCLRSAAVGEVNMPGGNTPGALTLLSKSGTLTIDCEVEGVGAVTQIIDSPRKTKVKTLDGFDCRLANLALGATPEAIKQFFADNLRSNFTRTEIQEKVNKRASANIPLPFGNSITDILNDALANSKKATTAARAVLRAAEAAAAGSINTETVVTSGSVEELESALADARARYKEIGLRRGSLTIDAARWDAAQTAAINARERVDALKAAPKTQAPLEADINERHAKIVDADNIKERANTIYENALQAFASAKTSTEYLRAKLNDFEARRKLGAECPTCGQAVGESLHVTIEKEYANVLGEWKASQVHEAAVRAEVDRREGEVRAAQQSSDLARLAYEKLVKQKEQAIADSNARDKTIMMAEQAAKETAAAAANMTAPPSVQQIEEEQQKVASEIGALEEPLRIARARQEASAQAASFRRRAVDAKNKYDECVCVEAAIKATRDEAFEKPAAELAESMRAIANVIGGRDIVIDPGDDERAPTIGVVTIDGRTVPFPAISEGRRAAFLTMLSARLLERSAAPEEKRILLIEAGTIDRASLKELVPLVWPSKIGHIVLASQNASIIGAGEGIPAGILFVIGERIVARAS